MENKSLKTAYTAAAAVITVLCTILILFMSAGKTQMHMDEVWSFGLANSYGRPQFYPTIAGVLGLKDSMDLEEREDYQSFYGHWHPGSYFGDYVTVQKGEQFSYGNVWHNQTLDTSPPLYYALIHTICSFFPDSFSKWYGLIPNIIFYALSLWLVWLIARHIFGEDIRAVSALLLWGISRAAISDAIFIRMYMMQTFLVLLLVWLFIRIISGSGKLCIPAAAAVSIIGFLTQYYTYIIAFILTLCTCIILLIRKKVLRALLTGASELAAVGIAFLLFPAVSDHVFHGVFTDYTSVSLRALLPVSLVFEAPGWYYFFEGFAAAVIDIIIAAAAVAAVVPLFLRKKGGEKLSAKKLFSAFGKALRDDRKAAALLLITAFLFSFYFISTLAPMHNIYSRRYLFPVMPLLAVIITGSVFTLCRFAVRHLSGSRKAEVIVHTSAYALIIAAAALNSISSEPFLAVGDHGRYDIHSAVAGKNVLFINTDPITSHSFSYDLSSAASVLPVDSGMISRKVTEDGKVVFVNRADEQLAALRSSYDSSEPIIAVTCMGINEEYSRVLLNNAEGFDIKLIAESDHLLWEYTRVFVYELTPEGT